MTKPATERRIGVRSRVSIIRDALFKFLRFIEHHVSGFHGPVLAFLLIGLLGASAVAFFAFWARVVMRGTTTAFDDTVLRWFAAHRTPHLNSIMLQITSLGNPTTILVLLSVSCLFLWLTQHRYSVYLLLIGILGGTFINTGLKLIFHRDRPSIVEWVTQVSSESFPSGHAMMSLIAYGSVAYLVGRLEPSRLMRIITWILAVIIILAIGTSRVYLGVHYPSDVIAGYVGGLAWLSFVTSGITAMQYFSARKPEVEQVEKDLYAEPERASGVRT
jgi:membrane-associated phospholipid phosphatase